MSTDPVDSSFDAPSRRVQRSVRDEPRGTHRLSLCKGKAEREHDGSRGFVLSTWSDDRCAVLTRPKRGSRPVFVPPVARPSGLVDDLQGPARALLHRSDDPRLRGWRGAPMDGPRGAGGVGRRARGPRRSSPAHGRSTRASGVEDDADFTTDRGGGDQRRHDRPGRGGRCLRGVGAAAFRLWGIGTPRGASAAAPASAKSTTLSIAAACGAVPPASRLSHARRRSGRDYSRVGTSPPSRRAVSSRNPRHWAKLSKAASWSKNSPVWQSMPRSPR